MLSAIDDLCQQIAGTQSSRLRDTLYLALLNEFGTSGINSLMSLVPSVSLLVPSLPASLVAPNCQVLNNMGFTRLCFTLESFVRILMRSAGLCIIFLDDLQWADRMSLGVMQAIISGLNGAEGLLFVGSYRINDVENGQHDFCEVLSKLNARFTVVGLHCIDEQSVNLMISGILGIVPRLCQSLSSIVCRKTKGNPFFVQQFLRTLVDKDLLIYSLREKRWIWDVDSE